MTLTPPRPDEEDPTIIRSVYYVHSNRRRIKHPANAVRMESRTVDTGEKKVIFGLTAKPFITTIQRPTKNGVGSAETIDAWYIEHDPIECSTVELLSELSGAMLVTYPELPDAHHVGPVPTGLAVELTVTTRWTGGKYGEDGRTMRSERIVESISDSPLDQKARQDSVRTLSF
jgi:hypothetical protein